MPVPSFGLSSPRSWRPASSPANQQPSSEPRPPPPEPNPIQSPARNQFRPIAARLALVRERPRPPRGASLSAPAVLPPEGRLNYISQEASRPRRATSGGEDGGSLAETSSGHGVRQGGDARGPDRPHHPRNPAPRNSTALSPYVPEARRPFTPRRSEPAAPGAKPLRHSPRVGGPAPRLIPAASPPITLGPPPPFSRAMAPCYHVPRNPHPRVIISQALASPP